MRPVADPGFLRGEHRLVNGVTIKYILLVFEQFLGQASESATEDTPLNEQTTKAFPSQVDSSLSALNFVP